MKFINYDCIFVPGKGWDSELYSCILDSMQYSHIVFVPCWDIEYTRNVTLNHRKKWEVTWTHLELFYFTFVSMQTGVGGLRPA